MQSRALVMTEDGAVEQRELDVPDLGPGEVLVRVELTGICGSDVHMRSGGMDLDYPVVPGHELSGVVEEVGEGVETDSKGDPVAEGDAVTVVPGINATEDWYTNHLPARPLACTDRKVYGFRAADDPPHAHGGMSEYFVVEADAHFFTLPDGMDVELGALVEPLSVATHAFDLTYQPGVPWIREGFGLGQSIAVQGAGPIGILVAAAASTAGAGQVVSIDMVPERLELAEEFGATDTVNISEYEGDGFVDAVNDLSPSGDGPDAVVEAVGHPSAFEQSLDLVRKGGTVIELGHYVYNGEAEVDPSQIIHEEINVRGSLAYPPNQFEASISVLDSTKEDLPYRKLFNHRAGFDDAEAAYDAQERGDAYRATIHPWE